MTAQKHWIYLAAIQFFNIITMKYQMKLEGHEVKRIEYFLHTFREYDKYLKTVSAKQETVSEDMQSQMMAHIGEFIVPDNSVVMTDEEANECGNLITSLLQAIDVKEIYRTKELPLPYKVYILKMKDGGKSLSHNWIIKRLKIGATILKTEGDHIHIEGLSKTDLVDPDTLCYVEDNTKKKYDLEFYRAAAFDKFTVFGDMALEGIGFKVDLPLKDGACYQFVIVDTHGKKHKLAIKFGKFSRLTSAVENTYFAEGSFVVKYLNDMIKVYRRTLKSLLVSEYRYDKELKALGKGYLVGIRRRAIWKKIFQKKPLWLIFDRTNIAGDNAEVLYRYMINTKAPHNYNYYFAIDKNSRGYQTMIDLSDIVDYSSDDYKLKFLISDKIISSQWADWVYNAFGEDRDYVKDMYSFKFIFLQHGVMKNDMSSWGHKLRKNISMILATTKDEYSSITDGTYGYGEDQVKLTGMPRFDLLRNEPQKIVSFMPTWRKYIDIETTRGRSERLYSDAFKETAYFRFYNDLINDPQILEKMRAKGYSGNFYVHPLFEAQYVDFRGNDVIQVAKGTADYKKVFREASLLVTDYSSVDMDFSYMKKPVIYTQFDKNLFFSTHTSQEGSFDSAKDGFGPVCFDYDSTVAKIVEYLENDCTEEKIYGERVDAYFTFTDCNNCKRVLDAIEAL